MEKINKFGELTTQQIVMLTILIASFAVLLFFLFRLNLQEETNEQICHNSVILESKSSVGFGGLNCKTSYVCVSGGEGCDEINPTKTISVNSNDKTESKEEIFKNIADEMSQCWWMFGEGKVDYNGEDAEGYHCGVCDIVKFDETIQNMHAEITYLEFYEYLQKNKMSDSQTYLQYLYGTNNLEEVRIILEEEGFIDETLNTGNQFNFDSSFSTSDKFSIVTGINPNFPLPDSFVYPSFVKSSEVKEKTNCEVFDITKA